MKKFSLLLFLSTYWLMLLGQTTIVSWSFTSSTAAADGGLAANIGNLISGTAGNVFFTASCGTDCTVPNPPYISSNAWQSTSPQPYYQTAAFTTTGYQNHTISFQSRSSNTGPADFQLQYKVGAGAFTDVPSGTYSNINAFNTQTFTLPASVDEQAAVQIRWLKVGNVAVTGGTVAAGGTSGLDQIIITGSSTAPVGLLSINAAKDKNRSIILSWVTANEIDNAYFAVERSSDGSRFVEIGSKLGAGTSHEARHYDFSDQQPIRGMNYYRLRQVDLDGKFEYSPVVTVTFERVGNVFLSPMPALDQVNVGLDELTRQPLDWQVYDCVGKLLLSGTTGEDIKEFNFNVSGLAAGAYILRIVSGENSWVQQFQKK